MFLLVVLGDSVVVVSSADSFVVVSLVDSVVVIVGALSFTGGVVGITVSHLVPV